MQRKEVYGQPLISGVFAAMTIPRTLQGKVDLDGFALHLQSLQRAGIEGFVLNGATGEYCLTESGELGRMTVRAREVLGPNVKLVAAVGGASFIQVMRRLKEVEDAGVDALLLPMPHFFPYEQQDLVLFSEQIAAQTKLPVLLYNLPLFTTPINPETALQLLRSSLLAEHSASSGGLIGIKDSSGLLDTVRLLTHELPAANRIIGNDSALYDALVEGLCDGVVSGVACVLPELMLSLYRLTKESPTAEKTLATKALLDEFIGWLGYFPVPWGLKIIALERGFSPFDLPLPLTQRRAAKRDEFVAWFRAHRIELLADEAKD